MLQREGVKEKQKINWGGKEKQPRGGTIWPVLGERVIASTNKDGSFQLLVEEKEKKGKDCCFGLPESNCFGIINYRKGERRVGYRSVGKTGR